jgi:hypothetical protein
VSVNDTVSTTLVANNGNTVRLLTPKVNSKKIIFLYVDSLLKGVEKKKFKHFLIEDFFDLLQVSTTQVIHLKLRISPLLMGYSWT